MTRNAVRKTQSSARERSNGDIHVHLPSEKRSLATWFPLLLSGLALLVTPIVVARIAASCADSGTDKDYVNIAVTILNSKDSTAENRAWALKILNKLSPIPFSEQGNERLQRGGSLYGGMLWGPDHPLIRKSDNVAQPCASPSRPPSKLWTHEQVKTYLNKVSKAFSDCALQHQYALSIVDILQNTNKTPAAVSSLNNGYRKPVLVHLQN